MYWYLRQASQNSWKRWYCFVSRNSISSPLLIAEIPLQLDPRRGRLGSRLRGRFPGAAPAPGLPEGLDHPAAIPDRLPQLAATAVARAGNFAQGHGLPRQFLANGSAHEIAPVEHPHLGHIPRVVAEQDLLAHVGGQRRVEVAHPQE